MKNRERYLFAVLLALVIASPSIAGAIKVWVNGESLTAADLNGNFAHIHNLMVGGHGPRLVNADVSATAAISTSKISNGTGIPKAWGYATNCDGGACTVAAHNNVTSISNTAMGEYGVTLSYTPTNVQYAVLVTGSPTSSGTGSFAVGPQTVCSPQLFNTAAPHITIRCSDAAVRADGGSQVAVQANFSFAVIDDN